MVVNWVNCHSLKVERVAFKAEFGPARWTQTGGPLSIAHKLGMDWPVPAQMCPTMLCTYEWFGHRWLPSLSCRCWSVPSQFPGGVAYIHFIWLKPLLGKRCPSRTKNGVVIVRCPPTHPPRPVPIPTTKPNPPTHPPLILGKRGLQEVDGEVWLQCHSC